MPPKLKGECLRLKLFDTFARNLDLHLPPKQPGFVCPICNRCFSRDDAKSSCGPRINIAHVHPSAAGGSQKTLECASCNNRMNRVADYEMARTHKRNQVMSPGSCAKPIDEQFTVLGSKMTGQWRPGKNRPALYVNIANNDPKTIHSQINYLLAGGRPAVATKYHPEKLYFAALHSAHLLMFRNFGYDWLMSSTGDLVKKVLNSEKVEDATFVCFPVRRCGADDPLIPYSVGFARLNENEILPYAALPHVNPDFVAHAILFPSTQKKYESVYEMYARGSREIGRVGFSPYAGGPARLGIAEYRSQFGFVEAGWMEESIHRYMTILSIGYLAKLRSTRGVPATDVRDRLRFDDRQFKKICLDVIGSRDVEAAKTIDSEPPLHLTDKGFDLVKDDVAKLVRLEQIWQIERRRSEI